jgi:hypothetical protein
VLATKPLILPKTRVTAGFAGKSGQKRAGNIDRKRSSDRRRKIKNLLHNLKWCVRIRKVKK